MTTKSHVYFAIVMLAISPVWGADRLATVELKGEWVVITCPDDQLSGTKAWTTVLRADAITSLDSFQFLHEGAGKADSPQPANIRIRTSETASGGVSRTIEIPAGTTETAPGLLQKLVELIDRGLLVRSGRGRATN
jgi:hypothetical protein